MVGQEQFQIKLILQMLLKSDLCHLNQLRKAPAALPSLSSQSPP